MIWNTWIVFHIQRLLCNLLWINKLLCNLLQSGLTALFSSCCTIFHQPFHHQHRRAKWDPGLSHLSCVTWCESSCLQLCSHRLWWPHLLWRSPSVLKAGSCAESARLQTLPLPHWLSVSCCMYVPQKNSKCMVQPWCMLADHMTQSQLTSVSVIQCLTDARTGVQGYSLISLTVTWWWTQHS